MCLEASYVSCQGVPNSGNVATDLLNRQPQHPERPKVVKASFSTIWNLELSGCASFEICQPVCVRKADVM